ncbi:MAG: ADP-glyceromanno-heptose 6-epimerase [Bacteriovoracaceae bacterium]
MILVTGAAGFIGSVLVKSLNDQGITNIILVDRLKDTSKWLNLRGLLFDEYIHADELFDAHNSRLFAGLKGIYHLGACSDTTEKNMDYLMKNNLEFSKKLFLFASQNQVPMVYASSAATYGDGEKGYSDDPESIKNFRPLNGYGYSKQLFDEWVLKQKRFPPAWYGMKFFNVYGPNEYHKGKMRSVVVQAHEQILSTGAVKLFKSYVAGYDDGEQKRDFIYVKDVVNAMLQLMKHGKDSGIYNMGTGVARTFKDLVNATFTAHGKSPKIEFIEMPDHLKKQYQYYTQAEMTKFKNTLPDFKFHSLEEGVLDYVQNYLAKDNPYIVQS